MAGFLVYVQLEAQTLLVQEETSLQPLENVAIMSKGVATTAFTNTKGQADISAFQTSDSIHISLIGYAPQVLTYAALQAQNFTVLLENSNIALGEVVVSASKWALDKRTVPNKITTISPEQVAFQNPQTAADLLGTSGDVFIQKSQMGGGSPMIRGFAANRVLIVVDGVRMNNAIFRSGNLQNVISLDPYAIQRTEVTFGPGSVLYGSDAIGGVMNFYTLSPNLATDGNTVFTGHAGIRYSSANSEKTGHVDLNIGGEKWSSLTSFTYSDFGDLKMGSKGPDDYLRPEYVTRVDGKDVIEQNDDPEVQRPTGYDQINLMQKVRFQPNADWNFNLGVHYSTTSDVTRYDRLIEYRNGRLRFGDWYYGPQDWLMTAFNVEHQAATGIYDQARLTLAYQYFQESRNDRSFNGGQLGSRTETVNFSSLNLDLRKALTANQSLFYGVEVLLNKVGSEGVGINVETGATTPISARYPDGSTWNNYAAYVNYRIRANDKLNLEAALRYSQVSLKATFTDDFYSFPFQNADLNTGALTGSAGMTVMPASDVQLNLNLSTGFRAPNIDDVGKIFDSEPGSVVVPNPSLNPEYVYNAEIGIVKTFGKVLKLDVTGFYMLLEDALVRRDFQLNGQDSIIYDGTLSQVQAIQNAAKANVWGIQAGLDIDFTNGLGLWSKFNYQKGEEQDEGTGEYVPLRHAAPFFGTTHLTYLWDALRLDLYANYSSEVSYENLTPTERDKPAIYAKDDNGNPYSPSWFTLNFKAGYQFTNALHLTVGVENILNERYRPYSSGIVSPGTNVIVGLRARF